jgi:hypothetical protein
VEPSGRITFCNRRANSQEWRISNKKLSAPSNRFPSGVKNSDAWRVVDPTLDNAGLQL